MKIFIKICVLFSVLIIAGCNVTALEPEMIMKTNNMPVTPTTPRNAEFFNIEAPLRCNVNWETQEVVSAIPYHFKAFKLDKNGLNDLLPRYEVTGFTFKSMPAERALKKLVKDADIRIIANDAPFPNISAENLRGELVDVIDMLTQAAEIYYRYDAHNKIIYLSRRASFSLHTPKSNNILLGLLDVIRGSGVTDFTIDWADYTVTFNADYDLERKVNDLVEFFEENPVLIGYDVSMFRIYPKNPTMEIKWQNLLKDFSSETFKVTKTGVLGRIFSTSDNLNFQSLQKFLKKEATVLQIAEGRFVVPNAWYSRFDVGKCGWREAIEADLSILAKTTLENKNRLESDITLDTTRGEITKFNIRSRLGENYLIIGLPDETFAQGQPNSETIIFMSPRIIRALKTDDKIINNIMIENK